MIKIVDNKILISKGDDAVIAFNFTIDNRPANIEKGEEVILTVKDIITNEVKITKKVEDNKIIFDGADTAQLDTKTYEYDLKYHYGDNEQVALIYPSPFVVKEVV